MLSSLWNMLKHVNQAVGLPDTFNIGVYTHILNYTVQNWYETQRVNMYPIYIDMAHKRVMAQITCCMPKLLHSFKKTLSVSKRLTRHKFK